MQTVTFIFVIVFGPLALFAIGAVAWKLTYVQGKKSYGEKAYAKDNHALNNWTRSTLSVLRTRRESRCLNMWLAMPRLRQRKLGRVGRRRRVRCLVDMAGRGRGPRRMLLLVCRRRIITGRGFRLVFRSRF